MEFCYYSSDVHQRHPHTNMSQCLCWGNTKIDRAAFCHPNPSPHTLLIQSPTGITRPSIEGRATLSPSGHLTRNTVVPRKRWLSLVELGSSAEHSENGISNRGLQLARNPELASLDWVQLASFSTPHSGISLSVSVHDATCS